MQQDTQTRRRSFRTAAQWSEIVERWRSSGVSARAFAEEHGLGESSLWRWSAHLARTKEKVRQPRVAVLAAPRFLTVQVAKPGSTASPVERGSIEVVWPGGPVVRVVGEVSADALVAAVRAVVEATVC